jgi:predicted O-linked N-acetylglucosamine transferase (SPINDLY family)
LLSSQIELQKILDLIYSGKLDDAEIGILKLLDLQKNNFLLFNIYGVILLKKNNSDLAIEQFKKSIEINRQFPDAYYNLGTTLFRSAKFKDALPYFKEAINIKKDYFEAHFNLAESYKNLEMMEEAISSFKECLNYQINDFETYNNLGLVYHKLNKFDDALGNFNKCLHINPNYFQGYNNIGVLYLDNNKFDEAIIFFNKCIKIKIDFVEAYNNLGMALHKKKKYLQAISILQKGIEIDPKLNNLYTNLANSLKYAGKIFEAISILKKEIQHNESSEVLETLAGCYCSIGEIEEGINIYRKILDKNEGNVSTYESYIFHLNYLEKLNFKEYFVVTNKIKEFFKKYDFNNKKTLANNNKNIKIGFVSGDFRNHAVGYQILEVIKYLSKDPQLELYAYYNDLEEDDLNKKFKANFKYWREIKNLNTLSVIKQIKSDQIQILIDLSGYTGGNRLEVFFNKPSPIQISWAGYLASTGLKEIDYIIADPHTLNLEQAKEQFVEKIWKSKDSWSVLTPVDNVIVNKMLPALKNGYVTFGSFNNLKKINKNIVKLWSRILSDTKDSKLILKTFQLNDEMFKEYFEKLFIENGAKKEQLIFEGDTNRADLLNKYNSIDIALDTFPYNGGTTSLEASWMCVPILTKSGNSFLSKCGESVNINLGLPEWTCKDDDDYVFKAITFSKNLNKLQQTKDYLINNRSKSKLFDSKEFADQLSNSFREMIDLNKSNI